MLFTALVPFLASVLLLLALSRVVSRWLRELLGVRLYAVLLWPGVVVHELSHLLGAMLTFTKVTGVSLLPRPPGTGGQVLGSVSHEATRNPVVLILISLFPLLGGSFILWVLSQLLLPGAPATAPALDLHGAWSFAYLAPWGQFLLGFWAAFNAAAWQSWVFAYLAVAIAAHLAPSNHDFGHAAAGFTALSLLAVLITWAAGRFNQAIATTLGQWIVGALNFFVPLLWYALGLLAVVAFLVGLVYGLKRLNQRVVW